MRFNLLGNTQAPRGTKVGTYIYASLMTAAEGFILNI